MSNDDSETESNVQLLLQLGLQEKQVMPHDTFSSQVLAVSVGIATYNTFAIHLRILCTNCAVIVYLMSVAAPGDIHC